MTEPSPQSPPPMVPVPPEPVLPEARPRPWVELKNFSFSPAIYPAMLRRASPDARAGHWVHIYDRDGRPFGAGLYNPKARVPLRVFQHGPVPADESILDRLLDQALDHRLVRLKLPEVTDAFRAVHSDGDGLGGLVVDRYADVLSCEVHSLGIFQRLPRWLPTLHQRLGTRHALIQADERIAQIEGFRPPPSPPSLPQTVKIREHGVRFEVDFANGHKTGFFCDQRDNRRRFAQWIGDGSVLDLCCYTGGFALAAWVLGGTRDVTGVDLDETSLAQARRNANLNNARVDWVHCDAFSYARQMHRNSRRWDAVVLDPPKLLHSRDETREGERKYEDLNSLGISLVRPGGVLVTCSCSGLLSSEEFERWVCRAAHRIGRRLQILERTGPGEDHPVMSDAPEGRYLKVLWARVFPL